MKNILKLFFLLIVFYLASCKPSPQKASEYNNLLVKHQRAVINKFDDLIASFTTYNAQAMQEAYNALIKQIDFSLKELEQIKSFDGDTEFRDKTIELLEFYRKIAQTKLKQTMVLLSKPEKDYTTQDASQVSKIMSEVHNEISIKNKEYKEYQRKFAQKYNLSLSLKE